MNIIGHQKIINLLDRSIKGGKIVQAYLFSGPESVGKFTLARIFAQALITDTPILPIIGMNEQSNKLLDLIIIEPEREEKRGVIKEKEIKIDQIRDAQKNLLLFPYSGKYKVLIVNNAHRMSEMAQNSLLKILEEPNSTSVIVLVTHDYNKILPTLKSRCQKINFSLVAGEEIKKRLENMKIKNDDEIITLSLGRPGIALTLCEDKEKFNAWQKSVDDLKKLPSLNINQRLEKAEELSKNIVETVKKLELWIWMLHLESFESEDKGEINFKAIEKIEKSILDITQTNAGSRLILENLLINI